MTTEERLEKLERELYSAKRRNWWLLAGAGLAVGLWALLWAFSWTPSNALAAIGRDEKVLRANMLLIEDENGKVRAALGVDKDAPRLNLFNENGQARAALDVTKEGPRLVLLDEEGEHRATLAVGKDGPTLLLGDENGQARAALDVTKEGPGERRRLRPPSAATGRP